MPRRGRRVSAPKQRPRDRPSARRDGAESEKFTLSELAEVRHLLSHREDGIKIQVYVAIIACMLITLWTGRKPTLRTVEMLRFYFMGWATEQELEAHIAKLKKRDE